MKTTLYRRLRAAALCLTGVLLIASCDNDSDRTNPDTAANALPLTGITTRGATASSFTEGQQLTAKFTYENTTKTATLTYSSAGNNWSRTAGDAFYWQSSTTNHTLLIYSAGSTDITLPTAPSAEAGDNYYLKQDRLYYRYQGTATDAPASILLEHALSKLTVNLQHGEDMTAEELNDNITVQIADVYTQGSVNTNPEDENGGKASNGSNAQTITLCQPNTGTGEYCTLLIPGQTLKPAITVSLNGTKYIYTATEDITTTAGQNHTYTLKLNRTGISGISATVEDWGGENGGATEIQMNKIKITNNTEGGLKAALQAEGIEENTWKYNKVGITGALSTEDYNTLKDYVNSGKIRAIKFPEGEEIPANAFIYCTNLIAVDLEGVKSIDDSAFYGCRLTRVDIPASLTSPLGDSAFCDNQLTEIHLHGAIGGVDNLWWVFKDNNSLKAIYIYANLTGVYGPEVLSTYPPIYIGNKVTTLNIAGLISATTPSVTPIGETPMEGVIKLPSSVTKLPADCFNGCTKLTRIDSFSGLEEIGDRAFSATGITNIPADMPDNLKLGNEVFKNCTQLTTEAFKAFIEKVDFDKIGTDLFRGCSGISGEVTIPSAWNDKTDWKGIFNGTGVTDINLNGVTQIGKDAFRGCSGLTSIDLTGVISIGDNAFHDNKMGSIVIPGTVVQKWGQLIFRGANIGALHIYTTVVPGYGLFQYGKLDTLYIHADISGDYVNPFQFSTPPATLYVCSEVTTLRTANLVGDNLQNVVVEADTPPKIADDHTPFTAASNPTLYLPNVTDLDDTWKTWADKTWSTIYYNYKGSGDKASPDSYNNKYTKP